MDPQLLVNLLVQVPALGVVVYLVIHFLSYVKNLRDDDRKFVSDLVADYKGTLETCHETIKENTQAVTRFNDSIARGDMTCPVIRNKHDEDANH